MQVTIQPSKCSGTLTAPPSKSMSHRLLICAGLSNGTSRIDNIAFSDDVLATIACLRVLGANIETSDDAVTVRGIGNNINAGDILPCGECGSTMRFFIGIALLGDNPITLTGSQRLLERPLTVYKDLCRRQDLMLKHNTDSVTVCGRLTPGRYEIDGSISSQFVSGLLFALPLLEQDSTIVLTGHIESRPYIDMTLDALAAFGVKAEYHSPNEIFIRGGQSYKAHDAAVEGDWSNAAFFLALGDDVTLTGLRDDSLQGDKICSDYFAQLCKAAPTLDISDCPDLGPILFAFAAAHNGATFTGTARLRIKESDRAAAMHSELAKMGISLVEDDNTVIIKPAQLCKPAEPIDSHNDHRIAMAMATLLLQTGGTLTGAECVNKSLPDFFDRLEKLGAKFTSLPCKIQQ